MADFCKVCSNYLFHSSKKRIDETILKEDINFFEVAKGLKKNYFMPILCEGCGANAVLNSFPDTFKRKRTKSKFKSSSSNDENQQVKKVMIHFIEDENFIWYEYDENVEKQILEEIKNLQPDDNKISFKDFFKSKLKKVEFKFE